MVKGEIGVFWSVFSILCEYIRFLAVEKLYIRDLHRYVKVFVINDNWCCLLIFGCLRGEIVYFIFCVFRVCVLGYWTVLMFIQVIHRYVNIKVLNGIRCFLWSFEWKMRLKMIIVFEWIMSVVSAFGRFKKLIWNV